MGHIQTILPNELHHIVSAAAITYIIFKLLFTQYTNGHPPWSRDDLIHKTPAHTEP